jgi:predicted nucleotidyltransferase
MSQLSENKRQETLAAIVASLSSLNLQKIVLFGSYASGTLHKDSDIDLLVVTSEDFMPRDLSEKNAIYLRISRAIYNIRRQIPIDLIVHTKAMHDKFIELGSMFSKKIQSDGVVLYEKND